MPRPLRSRKPTAPKSGRKLLAEGTHAGSSDLGRTRPDVPTPAHADRLPTGVARQAQREMDRLRRLPTGSPEAASVRAYLHWLWALPWQRTASENTDLRAVEKTLEREHLGLTRAKERIVEYLAVRKLKADLPGPAICLVGPAGTGKTSLGAAVARALNRPFIRITVSGTSDAGELVGVGRMPPGAQPGKIVQALREAGVCDPVLMIDGVDGSARPAQRRRSAARPAGVGIERPLRRPVPGAPDRSLPRGAAPVREPSRLGPRRAAGAPRGHRSAGLQRGREARDRAALPAAARPARPRSVRP
jgi:hypothetical protein